MLSSDDIDFQSCSRARYNACQNQCRIARFLAGETIFSGNCPCERPIECRFDLGKMFVSRMTEDPQEIIDGQTELFPDVKNYIQQVWSE